MPLSRVTHDQTDPAGREIAVALSLMRMALALLDRSDDGFGAARLQHAIDTVARPRAAPPEE